MSRAIMGIRGTTDILASIRTLIGIPMDIHKNDDIRTDMYLYNSPVTTSLNRPVGEAVFLTVQFETTLV